jgi:hypothetical protein
MRGMGRIFKRGSVYWIAYSYRNKEYRESSQSESQGQARKLLKKRIGEAGAGQFLGPNEERVTFDDMADVLLTDYEINKLRSIRSLKLSIKHLKARFGLERAIDITTDKIKKYIADRQRDGAANGSTFGYCLYRSLGRNSRNLSPSIFSAAAATFSSRW